MPDNKNDPHSQQSTGNSVQQPAQHNLGPDPNKANIKVPETEERDAVITDQRRPQFRFSENFGRRNFR